MEDEILKLILAHYRVSESEFDSKQRYAPIVIARYTYYYILYRLGYRISQIQDNGCRHASTITHGIRLIEAEKERNADLDHFIALVINKYKFNNLK